MRNLSTSLSLSPTSQVSTVNTTSLLQGLMESWGWRDQHGDFYAAEAEQQSLDQQLRSAIDRYLKMQDSNSKMQLMEVLREAKNAAKKEYDYARRQQAYYQEQVDNEAKESSSLSYLGQWSQWAFQGVKSFFGSIPKQVAEKYAEVAEARQNTFASLSDCIDVLEAEEEISLSLLSSTSRKSSEVTERGQAQRFYEQKTISMKNGQFPEIFNLADLNGLNGFKLDGENNNDFSGAAVSSAGDINGDGYSDLIIGANGYPEGKSKGRSYVIFGGIGVGSSDRGVIQLANLNGSIGFKLDGETDWDISGSSVRSAGDINRDGYDDMLIGARRYPGGISKGRTYLVFGGSKVGNEGVILLSSLNGTTGFKLDGENNGDGSGVSINTAGDINKDGYADLLIGAYAYPKNNVTGRSYVVFGGIGVGGGGSDGIVALSNLTISTGLKLDGENNGDASGNFVSFAGDINGDGYDDILIGAPGYPGGNRKGCSYVIFGGTKISNNGVIKLSNLSGTNGFKINGEFYNDTSGNWGSAAGDFNADGHDDLIIGAYNYLKGSNRGCGYVLFGGAEVGSSGTFELSNLDGVNGFKLEGENDGDYAGQSVSKAGDINGDGYVDLFLGAPNYPAGSKKGRSYILFGGPEVFTSGIISLSDLDGVKGFKLDGELNGDCGGYAVNSAGDVNGDGIADIMISAIYYPAGAGKGRTYVIFGDVPPVLVNNYLILNQGDTLLVNSSMLLAVDANHNSSQLFFIIGNLQHGQFAFMDAPDKPVTVFSQQSVLDEQIIFQHDGGSMAPAYSVSVNSTGIAFVPAQSAIIDFDPKPILVNNSLSIYQGQSVTLSTNNLYAEHQGVFDPGLNFMISNMKHGSFMVTNQSYMNNITFKQQDIINAVVIFTHDNSTNSPGYDVIVSDGRTQTAPNSSWVSFDPRPVLVNNQLLLSQGEKRILTIQDLSAMHQGVISEDLEFIIQNNQYGQFERASNPNSIIFSFSQGELLARNIIFAHDNNSTAPSYQVKAYDGITDSGFSVSITVLVTRNNFLINQGQSFLVTTNALNITSNSPGFAINWIVDSAQLQHGRFEQIAKPNQAIYSFTQQQVDNQEIVFVPDGTDQAPGFIFQVNSGGQVYGTVNGSVDFATPPLLQQPYLEITPPKRVHLTDLNLQASYDRVPLSGLLFSVSEVHNDYFAFAPKWDTPIFNFTQQDVLDGNIWFIDDSGGPPSFMVSVSNGRMNCTDCPKLAKVVGPDNGDDNDYLTVIKKSLIAGLVTGVVGLAFFVIKCYLQNKRMYNLHQAARESAGDMKQAAVEDNLLELTANEVFSRIKIDGCLGYISQERCHDYIGAVSVIIAELEKRDIIHRENWKNIRPAEKIRIIDAIAEKIKEIVGNNRCCSTRTFTSFYKAEVTPKMMRDKVKEIADAVQERLSEHGDAKATHVKLYPRNGSLNNNYVRLSFS